MRHPEIDGCSYCVLCGAPIGEYIEPDNERDGFDLPPQKDVTLPQWLHDKYYFSIKVQTEYSMDESIRYVHGSSLLPLLLILDQHRRHQRYFHHRRRSRSRTLGLSRRTGRVRHRRRGRLFAPLVSSPQFLQKDLRAFDRCSERTKSASKPAHSFLPSTIPSVGGSIRYRIRNRR